VLTGEATTMMLPVDRTPAWNEYVAVVTGGSRGIGAATALLLASRGHPVCVSYVRDSEAADAVVRDCVAAGASALAVRADVAVEADVVALFEAAQDRLGAIGGLVNNAGVVDRATRVEDMSAARIERMLAVNVTGAFLCAREAVRRMSTSRGGDGGAIVNVSSRAAVLGSPGEYVDYAASKAAVDTLTVGLAREVAGDGIRVNAVRPGLIDTEIHADSGDARRVDRLAPTVPLQRPGRPEEVAAAIAWLLGEEASYVTGSFVDVGGGR
jgi:NAD(P)-dependent dehydrogenase (short-subunit alcohol dehydrogenase family)